MKKDDLKNCALIAVVIMVAFPFLVAVIRVWLALWPWAFSKNLV